MRNDMRKLFCAAALGLASLSFVAASVAAPVRALKVTVLSTMLADGNEIGEWGFAALVEVDGHRILFDTGAHSDVVLKNAQTMGVDLTTIPDVILSHWHSDHTTGFLPLRRAVMAKAPTALARTHVGDAFFAPRVSGPPNIERNEMIAAKTEYEQTGGKFAVHTKPAEVLTGVWLTGPVPRRHPERNWSGSAQIKTADGLVEDTVPDDMSLVIDTEQGLVVVTGCGHAGVINIIEHARTFIRPARVHALIGGVHLFNASEQTLTWTAEKLRGFGIDNVLGAHCTGVETVYRLRNDLKMDRQHCVVAAVGAAFELGKGIDPRVIAR